MATNRRRVNGRKLVHVVTDPAAPASGDPVRVGQMTGVALTNEGQGSLGATETSVDHGGVYDLSVKAINDAGNSAVAVGDAIYYVDGDTPKLSKKQSGYFFGFALEAVDSAATATIEVLQIAGPGPGDADILAGSIDTAALANNAVTNAKMADDAIDSAEIADGAIDPAHLAASAVETAAIAAGAVTKAKLAGGFNNLVLVAGQDETMDTTIPVTGIAVGDELIRVLVQDGTSGVLTSRAGADFTIGAGDLTVGANAADNTANKYLIFWNDLT